MTRRQWLETGRPVCGGGAGWGVTYRHAGGTNTAWLRRVIILAAGRLACYPPTGCAALLDNHHRWV